MDLDLARRLSVSNGSKILLFVMDGLGGLPHPQTGRSELETARTPNLDALARGGAFPRVCAPHFSPWQSSPRMPQPFSSGSEGPRYT